jgi:hypothetical protein
VNGNIVLKIAAVTAQIGWFQFGFQIADCQGFFAQILPGKFRESGSPEPDCFHKRHATFKK